MRKAHTHETTCLAQQKHVCSSRGGGNKLKEACSICTAALVVCAKHTPTKAHVWPSKIAFAAYDSHGYVMLMAGPCQGRETPFLRHKGPAQDALPRMRFHSPRAERAGPCQGPEETF